MAQGVKPLDASDWNTYTEEEPNSLDVHEVPAFMANARELFPQYFAMLTIGLTTGRRPSELRPLRRKGPTPELLWSEGVLLVRRSETRGEVVERTKTGRRLRIPLPKALLEILRWHQDQLPPGPMRESDLLFPSALGGYRAPSCLDKPIREIAKAAGIRKHLTPRFMRRTFQDLSRVAEVHDFVTRAISGHARPPCTSTTAPSAATKSAPGWRRWSTCSASRSSGRGRRKVVIEVVIETKKPPER